MSEAHKRLAPPAPKLGVLVRRDGRVEFTDRPDDASVLGEDDDETPVEGLAVSVDDLVPAER